MKKILITLMLSLLVFVSCDVITEPMPLYGYYLAKAADSSSGYAYCFALREDGTFSFIQRGEGLTTDPFLFEGTWRADLSHFDFFSASGTITFTPDPEKFTGSGSFQGLVFNVGSDNSFRFEWHMSSITVQTTLELENLDSEETLREFQNIPDYEFEEKWNEACGIETAPDDSESGSGEVSEGGEA